MHHAEITKMKLVLGIAFTILLMPMHVTSQDNFTLFDRKGCYYDNFQYDILPDLIQCDNAIHDPCRSSCSIDQPYCQSDVMTVDLCFQICTNQNARYFGLQDGSQCLCGGAFAPYDLIGAPPGESGCKKNCTGDPSQACGGSFEVIVYEIKDPTSDCFQPGFLNVKEDFFPPIGTSDFLINDTLEYNAVCQSPSNLTGTPSITCTNNSWSNPPPECTIRCSPPEPMQYVVFDQLTASYEVAETLSYTCVVNSTNHTTECGHRGLWTSIDCPVGCSRSNLPTGGALADAPLNTNYFAEGALVSFVCDGAPLSVTFSCGDSGGWNISGFICTDIVPPSVRTSPMPDQSSTRGGVDEGTVMSSLGPSESSSTTEVAASGESSQGWIVAVAVVIPLILIIIIIIAIIVCYRKRKDEKKRHVPQVVLGYIKKRGTLGGTLKRNHDPEKDLTDNPEADSDIKKGGTLTHSLSAVKQQFVKRVTLNRNRPELPPKKKKSSSQSVASHAGVGYVAPKGVRTASEVDVNYPNANKKRVSTISMVSPADTGFDEVFNRTSRSSEMLDALMVEFDGRVNFGFENEDSSTAQSSPSLAPKTSPDTEHVVVHAARPLSPKAEVNNSEPETQSAGSPAHSNGTQRSPEEDIANENQMDSLSHLSENSSTLSAPESEPKAMMNGDYTTESPYDSLGTPRPAPPEILKMNGSIGGDVLPHYDSTSDKPRPEPLKFNTNGESGYANLPGQESPKYATLTDVQSPNGAPGATSSPLTKHDYVNVGRGNTTVPVARFSAEFHHPRPPSLPPDDSP